MTEPEDLSASVPEGFSKRSRRRGLASRNQEAVWLKWGSVGLLVTVIGVIAVWRLGWNGVWLILGLAVVGLLGRIATRR